MAKKGKTDKPNIYFDENAKKNPYWVQFMINGKRHTKRGFKGVKDAQKYLSDTQSKIHNNEYVEPSKTQFKDYYEEWITNKKDISEETRELYDSYLRTHIEPFFEKTTLEKLTPTHIQRFVSKLYNKNLADNTVKRIFSTVNACLNTAERMDVVAKNVADKIDKPKVRKKKLNVWDQDTALRVVTELTNNENRRYGIVIILAIMTGLRRGEILGLRWQDIDLTRGVAHIQQTVTPKRKIKDTTKTDGSSRPVALTPETIKMLEEHKKKTENEKQNIESYQDHGMVICNADGKPVHPAHIYRLWKHILKKYSLPIITFRDLRHTHATLLLIQGVHAKIVSERLGHSSVNITLDTYSHVLPNIQEEAIKGLDILISK